MPYQPFMTTQLKHLFPWDWKLGPPIQHSRLNDLDERSLFQNELIPQTINPNYFKIPIFFTIDTKYLPI